MDQKNIQKKIISFDIGIKNMALCLFSLDTSNNENPFKIDSWKVLNLMNESTESVEKCNQVLPQKVTKKQTKSTKSTKCKKNIITIDSFINNSQNNNQNNIIQNSVLEICQKPAKFMKKSDSLNCIENTTQYFCEKCAKKNTEFLIPKKSYQISSLKKLKIEELEKLLTEFSIELRDCKKTGDSKKTGESVKPTKKAFIDLLSEFFQKKCFAPVIEPKRIAAGDTDLITIGRNMVRLLDEIPEIYAVDMVLIENQISTIATRMKSVQGMLAQYFIMRCPNAKIEFVSSANKLRQFTINMPPTGAEIIGIDRSLLQKKLVKDKKGLVLEKQETKETPQKQKYKKHKTDGVQITREILEKNTFLESNLSVHLSESKKKDDLADAFLQGIWFLKKIERIQMENFLISLQK